MQSSSNFNDLFGNLFEDKNKNGTPDIFEHTTPDGQSFSIRSTQIVVNGKEYKSMDDVPENEKEKLAEILKRFEDLRPSSTIFTSADFSAKPSEKPKESKIIFTGTESNKKISAAKIFNVILIILLAVAAWVIWGRR